MHIHMHTVSSPIIYTLNIWPPRSLVKDTVNSVDFGEKVVKKTLDVLQKNQCAIQFCEVSKYSGTVTEYTSRIIFK